MGKRELLLVAAFLIVGAVVYQATAPPSRPDDRSVTFSHIVEKIRREIRGNRANAEIQTVATHELDATVREIRIAGSFAELTVTGENRPDVEARLRVVSNGYDDAEAKQLAQATHLKVDRGGGSLGLESKYPDPGQQRAFLTLLVPSRLTVRIDPGSPKTTVTNVAGLEAGIRGETIVKKVAGRATITHRSGRITIDDVAALKLTARSSDATVSNVRGDASFSLQAGELNAMSIAGPIDIESQRAEVVLRKLEDARGPLRVNATAGSVTLEGLRGDARVDGRDTEIDIAMSKPAPLAVYNEGDEPIDIATPPGGFVLDALVTNGRLTLPDDLRGQLSTSGDGEDREQRANGSVRGGGPTITLRANRGDIRVRTRANAER